MNAGSCDPGLLGSFSGNLSIASAYLLFASAESIINYLRICIYITYLRLCQLAHHFFPPLQIVFSSIDIMEFQYFVADDD